MTYSTTALEIVFPLFLGIAPLSLGIAIYFSGKYSDLWARDSYFRDVTTMTAFACGGLGLAFVLPAIWFLITFEPYTS